MPTHRAPENLGNRNAQEGGGNIWPVVDVLLQRASIAARPLPISDERDGINLQEEGRRTARWGGFWVKDVRFAHRQLGGLQPLRILVE